jgi:hypothetical protein
MTDFHQARGDTGDADRVLKSTEESVALHRQLFEASPTSVEAAHDLVVSLNRLGHFYLERAQNGDAERALKSFWESIEKRERAC